MNVIVQYIFIYFDTNKNYNIYIIEVNIKRFNVNNLIISFQIYL